MTHTTRTHNTHIPPPPAWPLPRPTPQAPRRDARAGLVCGGGLCLPRSAADAVGCGAAPSPLEQPSPPEAHCPHPHDGALPPASSMARGRENTLQSTRRPSPTAPCLAHPPAAASLRSRFMPSTPGWRCASPTSTFTLIPCVSCACPCRPRCDGLGYTGQRQCLCHQLTTLFSPFPLRRVLRGIFFWKSHRLLPCARAIPSCLRPTLVSAPHPRACAPPLCALQHSPAAHTP